MNYRLDEHGQPVLEPDLMEWARWYESADRTVGKTRIGDVLVSTIFLGIDHSFAMHDGPVLWETMVFGGTLDGEQERYVSLDDAKAGHAEMVKRVQVAA